MRNLLPITADENKGLSDAALPPSPPKWHWWLFILALGTLAFGIRIYYVTHSVVFQPVYLANVHGDGAQYYHYAVNLLRHSVFSLDLPSNSEPKPDNFRDPGYPVLLAGLLLAFKSWGTWYAAVLIFQALLGAITVVLWMGVGREWMPTPYLVAAGLLMGVWPHSVTMSSYILSETLFGFLCAMSMLLFRIATNRNNTGSIAISGISFSLAALTNAVMLPFGICLAIYARMQRKMSTKTAGVFVAVALCTLAPWSIRNTMLPGGHLSSTSRARMNLVQGSWPEYHDAYMTWARSGDPKTSGVLTQINQEVDLINAHPAAGTLAILHRLAGDPWKYVHWYLTKPALMWGWSIRIGEGGIYVYGTRNSPYDTVPTWRAISAICYAINPLLLLLAAAGCILAMRSRAPLSMTATALMLLFVTLVYSILQAEPRYSIPYRGPEILLGMFSAYWLSGKVAYLRARSRRATA
ncbi:ArnT family glycosyltransferase [Dyella flava]|uniref:Glycosyltransferase family 39 protein n=1 Tax=Dyella flava TaxID=1920170 RepID=A0ABS2K6N5_9GAMM|nr:glycosyltransferase family 39 protein [Dyella flava]MBM7126873.1 glycosyltransferase family 39 protein [Dyella flava]